MLIIVITFFQEPGQYQKRRNKKGNLEQIANPRANQVNNKCPDMELQEVRAGGLQRHKDSIWVRILSNKRLKPDYIYNVVKEYHVDHILVKYSS